MTGSALREIFTLANEFKEGDRLVGGTADDRVRDETRRALSATTIGHIRRAVLVDDGVTASLQQSRDRRFDAELESAVACRLFNQFDGDAADDGGHQRVPDGSARDGSGQA
jgi:ethanolamine ammonia-lyase large subunit